MRAPRLQPDAAIDARMVAMDTSMVSKIIIDSMLLNGSMISMDSVY